MHEGITVQPNTLEWELNSIEDEWARSERHMSAQCWFGGVDEATEPPDPPPKPPALSLVRMLEKGKENEFC